MAHLCVNQEKLKDSGVVTHICNHSTWEAEVGICQFKDSLVLHSVTLSQTNS